jgi:hypothetical protein
MNFNDSGSPIQRPCAIKKPTFDYMNNIIDEFFIDDQIDLFQQQLNGVL